jgi:DNA-binding response OmpR family regulator
MRVLIAEDDPVSRRLLETNLLKWGFEPVLARDGGEALQVITGHDPPRLLILDWMMPGVSGQELCEVTRKIETPIAPYIILLTALSDKAHLIAGLESGANDYLTKPFDRDELRARINVGIRVIQLQTELSDKVTKLREALDHVQTLQGIIPICSHCHNVRTDSDAWLGLEEYVENHSDAHFSHGICPTCLKKHHPDFATEIQDRDRG